MQKCLFCRGTCGCLSVLGYTQSSSAEDLAPQKFRQKLSQSLEEDPDYSADVKGLIRPSHAWTGDSPLGKFVDLPSVRNKGLDHQRN